MSETPRFTFAELHACAEREVKQRRRVYAHRVRDGRMSKVFADEEVAKMQAIEAFLRPLAEDEQAKADLFGGVS